MSTYHIPGVHDIDTQGYPIGFSRSNMERRIGAHVSISKGLLGALDKAKTIGANCIQIFSSPPQSFVAPKFSDTECEEFRKKSVELNIQPIFVHATYLINLASDKETLRELSIQSLVDDLIFAAKIGARGAIMHTGSHKGRGFAAALPIVVDTVKQILAHTPEVTKLYLEIASGDTNKIGSTLEELKQIMVAVSSTRLGVCLDTAHLFAGGYALSSKETIDELAEKIEQTIGWKAIDCLHVNDSKVEFGGGRDRHENIGAGFIGIEPFRLLLNHPKFSQLPFIIETPGFDGKGPDKENLEILNSLL